MRRQRFITASTALPTTRVLLFVEYGTWDSRPELTGLWLLRVVPSIAWGSQQTPVTRNLTPTDWSCGRCQGAHHGHEATSRELLPPPRPLPGLGDVSLHSRKNSQNDNSPKYLTHA